MIDVFPQLIAVSAVDAPAVVNTAAESSMLGPSGQCNFKGGFYGEGSTILLKLFGIFSNKATSPGTLQLKAKLGSTVAWSSGVLTIPATAHINVTFWLEILLMMRAGGANAKAMGAGLLQAVLGAQTDFPLPSSNPIDSATFDLTVDQLLDITAQFSVADPANSIQLRGFQVHC